MSSPVLPRQPPMHDTPIEMIQFFGNERSSARLPRRRIHGEHRGAADSNSRGIPRSASPLQGAQHSGHGRVLPIGARAQPNAGATESLPVAEEREGHVRL